MSLRMCMKLGRGMRTTIQFTRAPLWNAGDAEKLVETRQIVSLLFGLLLPHPRGHGQWPVCLFSLACV